MRRPRRAAGLTLLEVLAASALLALFFVGVFTVVFDAIRLRDDIESSAAPYAVGPAVMKRILDDFSYAQIDAIKDGDAFRASSESVGADDSARVDFVTAVPSRSRVEIRDEWVRAQLNETGYRLRRSESGTGSYALYRREDFGVDDDPLEGGLYYKVCDRVKGFTMDFFKDDPGDPNTEDARGETDWDAKKEGKLPFGARITLVLEGPPSDDEDEPARDVVFEAFMTFRSRNDKKDAAATGSSGR
ncbi:MAG: hypothetical protein HMLKMBBP_02581 [Planctomycetes bacterium]|nr:hypothetical protein [Planctomycetota bacterium]